MRYVNSIFWIFGVALLVWAIQEVDISSVGSLLVKLRWGFFLVLAAYAIVTIVDTIAWIYAFHSHEVQDIGFWPLWKIRQIGEAFNVITPLGTMGGEPIKAELLKDRYSLSLKQGLASLVVSRTTTVMSLTLFLIAGMIMIFFSTDISPKFKNTSLAGLVVFSTMTLLFLHFQVRGGLNVISGWLGKCGLNGNKLLRQLEILSHNISAYYRENPDRFGNSVLYMFIGWLVGIVELYLTLFFLGQNVSFIDLWIIEAMAQLIRAGSFFIPLGIGAQEGGLVLIFVSMGMTANMGLAVSFVRRIKDLLWVGVGLLLGWMMAFKPSQVKLDSSENP